MTQERINKFLTSANYCSRRQADVLITEKRVKINGNIAVLGAKVSSGDVVTVDDKRIKFENDKYYLAFNKPVGVICTTDVNAKDSIIDAVKFHTRVYPIGRLDVATSGLILLTNDGLIVNKILKGENKIEKEYYVYLDRELQLKDKKSLETGILMDGFKTLPAKIKGVKAGCYSVTIVEGKNRQVRRMFEELGYNIEKLRRVRIGNINLGDIPVGGYKEIDKDDIYAYLGLKKLEQK